MNSNSAFVNKYSSRQRNKYTKNNKQKCSGYHIIDVEQLLNGINLATICRKCKRAKSKLEIYELPEDRKGLAEKLLFKCNLCSNITTFETSRKVFIDKQKKASPSI